jgi:aspartate/methionine/tyrosine aminotransferase
MKGLSDLSARIEGQPMLKIMSRVQEMERAGRSVVHFELGEPDFDTPPHIVDRACMALREGKTHYTNSMGIYELREAIAGHVQETRGFRPSLDQVLVTPSANVIISYAVGCLLNPGEEMIVQDPCFPTYLGVANFFGVKVVPVSLKESNGLRLDPEDVRKAMTPRTRLILVNSPSNPTGAVLRPEEVEALYRVAEENDVYLLSDEIYGRMAYGDVRVVSPSTFDSCRERVIVLDGFSKSYAMTGWRIGYVIAPPPVAEKMGLFHQLTSTCLPRFSQEAAIEALTGPQDAVSDMVKEYRERRDLFVAGLNALPGVRCVEPGGAFYTFPNIEGTGMDDLAFSEMMLEEAGVSMVPGSFFGDAGKGFVRLCYATSRENIEEALRRMAACLKERGVEHV